MERVRYFYHTEVDQDDGKERTVAVAYRHNVETGSTSYGAAMFRQENPCESFVKSTHRSTALSRLNVRPVVVTVTGETYDEVEGNIRETIRTLGVGGKRQS
jgi:hypothetical protein